MRGPSISTLTAIEQGKIMEGLLQTTCIASEEQ